MTGDQQDMLSRLKAVLPAGWFSDTTPILDGLLTGLAWAWAWSYNLLQYVKSQTRIATTTNVWLDIIAQDFFGAQLVRKGQSDAAFRNRIQLELMRHRATRGALIATLQDLTGRTPAVFEPARATDTGGYGRIGSPATGLAYGYIGGWGSLALSFQCFVTAYRPAGVGISEVAGWGSQTGAYGAGVIEYASLAMVQAQVTDADICAAIAAIMPAATIGWTRITN